MDTSDESGLEPRRAVAAVGRLMPHRAPKRHHIYRKAIAVTFGLVLALASTSTSLADGGTKFSFPNGVTVTVAPGWTIATSTPNAIWADNDGSTAQIECGSANAHTPNINDETAFRINDDIRTAGYTNVVQSPDPDGVQAVQGSNFTQELVVGYSADHQTNQGTTQFSGVWIILYNPSTQLSATIDLRARNPADLKAATPGAKSMIGSML